MKNELDIVYMGTPDFAVPCLKELHESRHRIRLVVTQPDRPKGRGRKMTPPPVKVTAEALDYPVIQPESLKSEAVRSRLRELAPDLFVVVAMGHVLDRALLHIPRIGCINIHASLLPKYRGPAPIHRAVANGEKMTGVTTMWMGEGVDTGDILLEESTPIHPDDTAGTLHDRLAPMGARLLIETIEGLIAGTITPRPQDHRQATYAPMLKKEHGKIDWSLPAEKIDAFIRGMAPWPGAFTFFGEKRLKILAAKALATEVPEPPGTIIHSFPGELRVATGKGILEIAEIQSASGKRLCTHEFLCGFEMPPGEVLL